jgi:hypothetical protein
LPVKIDASWHLAGDLHPDPRAAQAIATAVAGRLQGCCAVLEASEFSNF